MTSLLESISFDGTEITLTLRPPNNSDWQALAAAASIRLLESFPVIQHVVLKWGSGVFRTSRTHVEQLLHPDGFAAIANRARWQDIVNRLMLHASDSKGTTMTN
jgi:hypothetical protein